MRCTCCGCNLTDYEATMRHALSGDFLDTCQECLTIIQREAPFPVRDRKDLIGETDIDPSIDNDDDL